VLAWVLALLSLLEILLQLIVGAEVAGNSIPAWLILNKSGLIINLYKGLLTHASHINNLLEGLNSILQNWLNRLHNTKSSFHVVNLWLHSLNGFHFSGNFNKGLSIVKSLQDSSSQSFLNILDCGGLSNSSGLIVSRFELESGLKSGFEGVDELGIRHSLKGLHILLVLLDESNSDVMMVVTGRDGSKEKSKGKSFHFLRN